jgi:hypothetical protein
VFAGYFGACPTIFVSPPLFNIANDKSGWFETGQIDGTCDVVSEISPLVRMTHFDCNYMAAAASPNKDTCCVVAGVVTHI